MTRRCAAREAAGSAAWIQPFGTLFLNLVKMLVVPLVFCSLTAGVGGLGDAPVSYTHLDVYKRQALPSAGR